MKLTAEQIEKAKTAKSAEELLAFAKKNGVEMTEEEAAKYFAELHKTGELSDNELNGVAAGCGEGNKSSEVTVPVYVPKFAPGTIVRIAYLDPDDGPDRFKILCYMPEESRDCEEIVYKVLNLETNTEEFAQEKDLTIA